MVKSLKIESHPLLPAPNARAIAADIERNGGTPEQALSRLLMRRNEVIQQEREDPFRYEWEPHIAKVADALIDWPWTDKTFEQEIDRRLAMTWEQFKQAMREHLGFVKPVTMLLIMGANRSFKSTYAAKRGQQMLTWRPEARVRAFHMSHDRSVEEQQAMFWRYMPREWKISVASHPVYIKYKAKVGFSDDAFINPIKSHCAFRNYTQDIDTAIEGGEVDLLLPDELVGPDWLETMLYRITTKGGKAIPTFTPIHGYTPSVKIFVDGARTVKESIGYMLPRDGQEPDPARTLHLAAAEYEELWSAEKEKRPARAPESRAEDCVAWLEGKPSQPECPRGRRFEMVPRVQRCTNPLLGVVYFHTCDNPFGRPRNVIQTAMGSRKGRKEIRMRVYGIAERLAGAVFAKFSDKAHILPADSIPADGTNYCFIDPAGDRNWFITYIRRTGEGAYVYREWPGNYEIPGIGVPEPWAIPSGRKKGLNDGDRGNGQHSFGFGLYRYKYELARLERWHDYLRWLEGGDARQPGMDFPYPTDTELARWQEWNGADEPIEQRFVDSRAANTPRLENYRPRTLYEDLREAWLDVMLTPGDDISEGVQEIVNALDYEESEEGSFFNRPHLYFSEDCINTIFAMQTWQKADGKDGATKDPIDNLRYFFLSGCEHVDAVPARTGFYYGRGFTGSTAGQGAGAGEHPVPQPRWKGKRVNVRVM